jgi:hypothetical protein
MPLADARLGSEGKFIGATIACFDRHVIDAQGVSRNGLQDRSAYAKNGQLRQREQWR